MEQPPDLLRAQLHPTVGIIIVNDFPPVVSSIFENTFIFLFLFSKLVRRNGRISPTLNLIVFSVILSPLIVQHLITIFFAY